MHAALAAHAAHLPSKRMATRRCALEQVHAREFLEVVDEHGEREAHNLTARRLSACLTATTRPAREEGGEAESGKGRRRQLRAVEVHSTDHGENRFRLCGRLVLVSGVPLEGRNGGHAPNKCCTFSHNLPKLPLRCDLRLQASKELGFEA